MKFLTAFCVYLALAAPAWAESGSGADALFYNLGGDKTEENSFTGKGIKLKDPFQVQFYSSWQSQKNMPYELNAWAMKVLKGEYAGAAHLWTVVQKDLPGEFQNGAKGAYLYCLWKLELPQTFVNAWLGYLANPAFAESRIAMALDQTIAPDFDAWLMKNAPYLSPEQKTQVLKLPLNRGPHVTTLQAWSLLRTGDKAREVMARLPFTHPLKIPLVQTVNLASARRGDLKGSAAVMKQHMEPSIDSSGKPNALAEHYVTVARLLYQAGALDAAETFYLRIPSGSPEFLQAREELVWVWLRQGKLSRLRGELTSLSTDVFNDKFAPDLYVVRAVSNLKLCYYDKVEKDLKTFIERNKYWAKKIDAAVRDEVAEPRKLDLYSKLANLRLAVRKQEMKRLEQLGEESIGASLPAVGPQKHWEAAQKKLNVIVELSQKNRANEFRRQWKNDEAILKEAIQKMRFVKVEFMSQVRSLSQKGGASEEDVMAATITKQRRETLQKDENEIAFPFDGVIWPDELFKIRSVAQAQCLKGLKSE